MSSFKLELYGHTLGDVTPCICSFLFDAGTTCSTLKSRGSDTKRTSCALPARAVCGGMCKQWFCNATGPVAAVFALIIVASIVPVLRGAERRSFLFFTSGAEIYLGRWAMLVRVAQCMGKNGTQRHGTLDAAKHNSGIAATDAWCI